MKKILSTICVIAALTGVAWGEQLLTNGDFATGDLKPWKLYTKKGLSEAPGTVADGVLTVAIDAGTPQMHERQLIQPVAIASGTKYLLSFDMKTASAGGEEIVLVITRTIDFEKGHYGLYRKFSPAMQWETKEFYFTTKEVDPADPPALKFNIGFLADDVAFRNLSLKATAKQ